MTDTTEKAGTIRERVARHRRGDHRRSRLRPPTPTKPTRPTPTRPTPTPTRPTRTRPTPTLTRPNPTPHRRRHVRLDVTTRHRLVRLGRHRRRHLRRRPTPTPTRTDGRHRLVRLGRHRRRHLRLVRLGRHRRRRPPTPTPTRRPTATPKSGRGRILACWRSSTSTSGRPGRRPRTPWATTSTRSSRAATSSRRTRTTRRSPRPAEAAAYKPRPSCFSTGAGDGRRRGFDGGRVPLGRAGRPPWRSTSSDTWRATRSWAAFGRVRPRVHLLVGRDQVGPGPGQPPEVVLPDPRAQVEQDRGDRTGPGLDARLHHRLQLLGRVGQPRQHRRHQHAARHPGRVEPGHRLHPPQGMGRARLGELPHLLVEGADGEVGPHVGVGRGLGQEVEVAEDQRRLGEDGERVAGLGQHLDDAPGEVVLALAPLVGVGVGAHGDVVARPPARAPARPAAAPPR